MPTGPKPVSPVRRLSAARLNEYRESFRIFDRDGSGAINVRELKALMASVHQMCSDEELEQMIKTVDSDGSGEIEFSEFLLLVSQRLAADSENARADEARSVGGISRQFVRSMRDHAESSWSRAVAAETRKLPMRRALVAIRRGSKLKSVLAFVLFYSACAHATRSHEPVHRLDISLLLRLKGDLLRDYTMTFARWKWPFARVPRHCTLDGAA